MENKYYLPKIEELHIGFECEIDQSEINKNFKWCEYVIGTDYENITIARAVSEVNKNGIRVKYLDRQDIESFGFKFEKDDEYAGEYYFSKENSIIGKFLTEDKKYNIEMFSTYFIVKNKSEFKKLLMQLDLINE